jgi:hypothetical protein
VRILQYIIPLCQDGEQYSLHTLHSIMHIIASVLGDLPVDNESMYLIFTPFFPAQWAPLEDCRLPGADQERLPFVCPMDYVLGEQACPGACLPANVSCLYF